MLPYFPWVEFSHDAVAVRFLSTKRLAVDILVQIQVAKQRSTSEAYKSMVICLAYCEKPISANQRCKHIVFLWEFIMFAHQLKSHPAIATVVDVVSVAQWSRDETGTTTPQNANSPQTFAKQQENLPGQQRQTYRGNGNCKKIVDHGSFARCNFSEKCNYWDLAWAFRG